MSHRPILPGNGLIHAHVAWLPPLCSVSHLHHLRDGPNAINLRKISLVHTVTPAKAGVQRS